MFKMISIIIICIPLLERTQQQQKTKTSSRKCVKPSSQTRSFSCVVQIIHVIVYNLHGAWAWPSSGLKCESNTKQRAGLNKKKRRDLRRRVLLQPTLSFSLSLSYHPHSLFFSLSHFVSLCLTLSLTHSVSLSLSSISLSSCIFHVIRTPNLLKFQWQMGISISLVEYTAVCSI